MARLHNVAEAEGVFDGVPIDAQTELYVELTALELTKRADKDIWIRDELEYTIEVKNIDTSDPDDPGFPVTDVTLTDNIDPTIARLVDGSVELDGVPLTAADYTYDPVTGDLTITVGTVEIGTPRIITFRVERVPQP